MQIASLTSSGHSEKKTKKKTVSCGRSDNENGAKRCEREKQLSSSLFVFSLLCRVTPHSSYVKAWNRPVECYAPPLLGLLRPRRITLSSICIIVQFIHSLIQQLLSILLPHHLHFFPTRPGPLGCGRVTYLMV